MASGWIWDPVALILVAGYALVVSLGTWQLWLICGPRSNHDPVSLQSGSALTHSFRNMSPSDRTVGSWHMAINFPQSPRQSQFVFAIQRTSTLPVGGRSAVHHAEEAVRRGFRVVVRTKQPLVSTARTHTSPSHSNFNTSPLQKKTNAPRRRRRRIRRGGGAAFHALITFAALDRFVFFLKVIDPSVVLLHS